MKTTYRWLPYYRKRLDAKAALAYFRTAKRMHRFTSIALTSICHARDVHGYFYDQGHIAILEYCSGGKLKGEVIPEEAERKAINTVYAKELDATLKIKGSWHLHDYLLDPLLVYSP